MLSKNPGGTSVKEKGFIGDRIGRGAIEPPYLALFPWGGKKRKPEGEAVGGNARGCSRKFRSRFGRFSEVSNRTALDKRQKRRLGNGGGRTTKRPRGRGALTTKGGSTLGGSTLLSRGSSGHAGRTGKKRDGKLGTRVDHGPGGGGNMDPGEALLRKDISGAIRDSAKFKRERFKRSYTIGSEPQE